MINIAELQKEKQFCVFIRHGEKNAVDYGLTAEGKKQIMGFSTSLSSLDKTIIIYSSPEPRCIETASIINNVVNKAKINIRISNILGMPGIQVRNETEYAKLTYSMRCRDIYKEWKMGKHNEAMNSPKIIQQKMIDFFNITSTEQGISLYISQSGTVACSGYSLGLVDYQANDKDWVQFLDGYIYKA